MSKKVIVIGSGPGGYPAALRLKALGAEVSIAEMGDFGGTCLNRGCIPSKAFLDTAHRAHVFGGLRGLMKDGENFTFTPDMLDWEKIKARRADVVSRIRVSLEKMFQMKKIPVLRGKAFFSAPGEVTVKNGDAETKYAYDAAVLASGTKPAFPPPFNSNLELITDSDRVFDLPERPRSVLIVGAGVIGLEFACFFNGLGIPVTILEVLPSLLPNEDPQVSRAVKTSFEKRGVKFIFGKKASSVSAEGKIKKVILEDGTALEADTVLVGAGRTADLGEMGLDKVGLEWNRKGVKVSPDMKTAAENIYAVGDVNGLSLLAHSATRQGEIAAENIMGGHRVFDANIVPRCIYAWPETASVGVNKSQAEAGGLQVKTSRAFFLGVGRAVASGETEGFVQLVYGAEDDVIIGAQIVGGPATEMIHLLALAVKLKLRRRDLKEMIFAHPTMSEAINEALEK